MPCVDSSVYPSQEACLRLLARYRVPAHVIRHSQTVRAVAMFLGRRLISSGRPLDLPLIQAAALLHDITKAHSFNRPLDHALTGAKLLKHLGHPEIAAIVRQHVRISRSRPLGRISEVELVNYSDKRVVEDQLATLTDRLAYIRQRYGRTPEALAVIEKFSAATFRLEDEIFSQIDGGPDQIMSLTLD